MKLIKLLLFLGLVVVGVIVWQKYGKTTPAQPQTAAQKQDQKPISEKDRPGVEEKYGFTTKTIDP